MLRAFRQIRQILVRQVDEVRTHILLRQFDEMRADRVTNTARTRVQHEPHEADFIQTDFDEVITGP